MTSMVRNVTTVAFPHLTKRAMLRKRSSGDGTSNGSIRPSLCENSSAF
jgi:hypothetical protein